MLKSDTNHLLDTMTNCVMSQSVRDRQNLASKNFIQSLNKFYKLFDLAILVEPYKEFRKHMLLQNSSRVKIQNPCIRLILADVTKRIQITSGAVIQNQFYNSERKILFHKF